MSVARHAAHLLSIYGFGQKTGIDLPGEANTASLMYQVEDMKPIDLATNAFGQNYNCTMVQMVSGFASLINSRFLSKSIDGLVLCKMILSDFV